MQLSQRAGPPASPMTIAPPWDMPAPHVATRPSPAFIHEKGLASPGLEEVANLKDGCRKLIQCVDRLFRVGLGMHLKNGELAAAHEQAIDSHG